MSNGPNTDRNKTEKLNLVRSLLETFGSRSEPRVYAYVENLQNYYANEVATVCKNIIKTEERLPAVASILEQLRALRGDTTTRVVDSSYQKSFTQEQERFEIAKAQFLNLFSEEILGKFVVAWFAGVYGINPVNTFGFGTKAFEKPALFDWAEANGKSDLAIRIGKRKIGVA